MCVYFLFVCTIHHSITRNIMICHAHLDQTGLPQCVDVWLHYGSIGISVFPKYVMIHCSVQKPNIELLVCNLEVANSTFLSNVASCDTRVMMCRVWTEISNFNCAHTFNRLNYTMCIITMNFTLLFLIV